MTTTNCNFENDMCGWVQMQNLDFFDWARKNGSTPSYDTGPTFDHTLNNSKFHYKSIQFLFIGANN